MPDPVQKDKIFFDHIGQIILNAILQGVIIGSRETNSDTIQVSVDKVSVAASQEVVTHARYRLAEIRQEILSDNSAGIF